MIVVALGLSGCATVMSDNVDRISVYSDPPGATLRLDGARVGAAPTTIPIKRSAPGWISFELDGYEPARVHVEKVMNPWTIGNILLGGLIGLGVDAATGAIGRRPREPVFVTLVPVGTTQAEIGAAE
jgi:hypothetical protein